MSTCERTDRDHGFCFQRFRAERERQRARQLAPPLFTRSVPSQRQLTPREIQHRREMLDWLERQEALANVGR